MGATLSLPLLNVTYNTWYPEVRPKQSFEWVAFLEPVVNGHLPESEPEDTDNASPNSYLTAFIAAQRIGKHTFVATTVDAALKAKSIVLIHSHFDLATEDIAKLHNWVKQGGHLILLDQGNGSLRSMQDMLAPTGLAIHSIPPPIPASKTVDHSAILKPPYSILSAAYPLDPTDATQQDQHKIQDTTGRELGKQQMELYLSGGTPVMTTNDKHSVCSEVDMGRGTIVASCTKSLFSDVEVGQNSSTPKKRQYLLLQHLFTFFGR